MRAIATTKAASLAVSSFSMAPGSSEPSGPRMTRSPTDRRYPLKREWSGGPPTTIQAEPGPGTGPHIRAAPGCRRRVVPTDIDSLIQRSARLEGDDIDFGAFRRRPLDPATLRCIRYMHDVEGHTACYMRDLLATRAHRDPQVTAFLACWCYEEHWHGEALALVLRAHGEPAGRQRLAESRRRLPRRDALRPVAFTLASAISPHIVAVHMTWGAVNEWTTQAGYGRLAARADHPVLSELLRRIMRQEGRHIDFYALGARRRLTESATARRLTRFALR